MKKNPGISIIIPTLNRETFLADAINSILLQKYPGQVEIIVSDDGSVDKTLEVASSFGGKVKIITKPQNCRSQGAAGARNRGLFAANQPFICFLDSDDYFLKGHLKKMMKVFEKKPNIGFAFCRVVECKEENGKRYFTEWTSAQISKKDIKNPVVSRSHIVHTNGLMFKKEVFAKAGIFNETYSNGEDGDMWMRISELYEGGFSDHFGAVYNSFHSEDQLTKNLKDKIRRNSLIIFKNAIERYHQLRLNDTFRIFKLKQHLVCELYRERKALYYYEYIKLILRYPRSIRFIMNDYFNNINNHKKHKKDFYDDISVFFIMPGNDIPTATKN
jgi:glycosyltransferase involved in cell wall biosynthesis